MIFFGSIFANGDLVLSSANSYINTLRANQNAPIAALVAQSKAIVVFPSVKKIGFVLGGISGDGVMIASPRGEREILSVSINGGSFGLQIGYENSSLVLFILKDNIVNEIKNSKITIQADASLSFGDTGNAVSKTSDFKFTSDIYAYATNSGFFAGASLGGAVIGVNDENLLQSGYAHEQLMRALDKF